jgi:hypothetical protein
MRDDAARSIGGFRLLQGAGFRLVVDLLEKGQFRLFHGMRLTRSDLGFQESPRQIFAFAWLSLGAV